MIRASTEPVLSLSKGCTPYPFALSLSKGKRSYSPGTTTLIVPARNSCPRSFTNCG